ncbi:hemerythrin domain-containing protein [Streptomyces sp. NPDC058953]|uniref:hemerythrin domain-containing protein n=1 Tax=unclassified Streptomyces TaxID=2593676 RepID=UPI0036C4AB53
MSGSTRPGRTSGVDLTMMYAIHRALRRDLGLLTAARRRDPDAFRTGWRLFTRYLTIHHIAEDEALWPVLRTKLADRAGELALLRAMEAEHVRLDQVVAKVEEALDGGAGAADGDGVVPAELMEDVAACLTDHLDHEEARALPLLESLLTAAEWRGFVSGQRRSVGLRGAPTFFPWLLDGVADDDRRAVLGLLPGPLRLVYGSVWRPRYERTSPWRRSPGGR